MLSRIRSAIPSLSRTCPAIYRKMSTESAVSKSVPDGFKPHTESSTTILVPKGNTAFLNPVQQYNRDLSIAVIRAWNEMRKEEAVERHERRSQKAGGRRRNKKGKQPRNETEGEEGKAGGEGDEATDAQPEAGPSKPVRKNGGCCHDTS